ncbi:hypothetical protein BpHYR1_037939 [Brachionus plicatilis]|uniref:Uncharacterized protein n=1 Tax=Brachionus plicatilis TaxID=10195 RepID=A0A3M7QDH7_BRAPC|nr:hypothetical protein BpHYR1_037939 [Brachionus plicatilis]
MSNFIIYTKFLYKKSELCNSMWKMRYKCQSVRYPRIRICSLIITIFLGEPIPDPTLPATMFLFFFLRLPPLFTSNF